MMTDKGKVLVAVAVAFTMILAAEWVFGSPWQRVVTTVLTGVVMLLAVHLLARMATVDGDGDGVDIDDGEG